MRTTRKPWEMPEVATAAKAVSQAKIGSLQNLDRCRRDLRRLPQVSRRNDRGCNQHSTALTAKPPRDVSLYLSCMSAPVSRMVRITRSSEMK